MSVGNESEGEEMILDCCLQFGSALVATWAIDSYLELKLTES